jgi:uncharacterized protein YPO0396
MATDTAQLRLLPGKVAAATYVLTDFEMYDWGAFAGRHHVPLNPAGTAIIGATGSGKSTFVDALMTLIAAAPRYNLASTGGHDSDRDLVSYVRNRCLAGVWISSVDRAGRSAAGCPRSVASTTAA